MKLNMVRRPSPSPSPSSCPSQCSSFVASLLQSLDLIESPDELSKDSISFQDNGSGDNGDGDGDGDGSPRRSSLSSLSSDINTKAKERIVLVMEDLTLMSSTLHPNGALVITEYSCIFQRKV